MTPPHTTTTSPAPCAPQLVDELGHERLVAGGLAGDADHVHVVLDRGPGDLGRRLEQRPEVDVEAEVGERGADDLGAPVVAVLAHLGHEDPGPAALVGGEGGDGGADGRRRPRRPRTPTPYTPEMLRISARCRPNTSSMAGDISPTVARARAASMHSASRLASPAAPSRSRSMAAVQRVVVAGLAHVLEPGDLLVAHLGVVDVEDVDVLGARPTGTR